MKKINFPWKSLVEALKEPLRLVLLAIISWIVTELIPQIDENWVVPLTVGLRFVDKWLHEYGKATNTTLMVKGLTRV